MTDKKETPDKTLSKSSNALHDLAEVFYAASKDSARRIMGNLRLDAIRQETTATERFMAYMEMALDKQIIGKEMPMKLTAIAFTDRTMAARQHEVKTGADMACFIRYDLPGLRWAKGFLGQSKLVKVHGWREDGTPIIGFSSVEQYDRMIKECGAMGHITDESYVFFYAPDSVTVERASNLLGDLGEIFPEKPWQDIHRFRKNKPIDIARFYGALAACQLGDTMLDKPVRDYGTVLDLIRTRGIATVLLLLVGTIPPQKPLRLNSPELKALAMDVPQTYWLWPQLLQVLMNR